MFKSLMSVFGKKIEIFLVVAKHTQFSIYLFLKQNIVILHYWACSLLIMLLRTTTIWAIKRQINLTHPIIQTKMKICFQSVNILSV